MSPLIVSPLRIFDIDIGPSHPIGLCSLGSHGPIVQVLHQWLRLAAEVTSVAEMHPGAPPADGKHSFTHVTEIAVNTARAYFRLPQTGIADADFWPQLQTLLTGPPPSAGTSPLPPSPDSEPPPFPDPSEPDEPNILRHGLRRFGFPVPPAAEDPNHTVLRAYQALFIRLNTPSNARRRLKTSTPSTFDDVRFWRRQWGAFRATWGRFVGAPWLGIVIDDTTESWGTYSLFRDLYAIGSRYLLSSSTIHDLTARLSNPIRISSIATPTGDTSLRSLTSPGYEYSINSLHQSPASIKRWLDAIRHTCASPIVLPDLAHTTEYRAHVSNSGIFPVNIAHSTRLPPATAIAPLGTIDSTYQNLSDAWKQNFKFDTFTPTPEQILIYRTSIHAGAYLTEPWAKPVPINGVSVLSGSCHPRWAQCTVISRGCTVTHIDLEPSAQDRTLSPFALIPSYTNHALNLSVSTLRLTGLTPDTAYTVTLYHNTTDAGASSTRWSFRTMPITLPVSGLSFFAQSCYCDYQPSSMTADGSLASRSSDPGLVNFRAVKAFLSSSLGAFFAPYFRALLGDNLYIDVAPDIYKIEGMSHPLTEVLGRYLRYMLCSAYSKSLSLVPNFAIPDDHEYWNDYPRPQPHLPIRTGTRRAEYDAASRRYLQMFQGAMTAAAQPWCLPGSEVVVCEPGTSLWRDYNPGSAVTTRGQDASYPYGIFDPATPAPLPPLTSDSQRVRPLVPGERFTVRRVLYQAETVQRGQSIEGRYQCIEIEADNEASPLFAWATYKDVAYIQPTSTPQIAFTYSYDIGSSAARISLFFLDCVSDRKYGINEEPSVLTTSGNMTRMKQWAATLTGPGVLVMGQPLFVPRRYDYMSVPADYLPSSFPEFDDIIKALCSAPWDIAIVAGDVHWSRITECDMASTLYSRHCSRYRPRIVEVISSPAQRIPAKPEILTGVYRTPETASISEMLASAPWIDTPGSPGPPGPIATAMTAESPTFAAFHLQQINAHAFRIDVTILNMRGMPTPRQLTSQGNSPRWCVPNEWIVARSGAPNRIWKGYPRGDAINHLNIRPFYPNGTFDCDEWAPLPPRGGTFVRDVRDGERFFVKRVLYQAPKTLRGDALEGAYQCIEVATAAQSERVLGYGSRTEDNYYIWTIYNDEIFTDPSPDHLYGAILRRRLPDFDMSDSVTIREGAPICSDATADQYGDGSIYEFGHEVTIPPFEQEGVTDRELTGWNPQVIFQAESGVYTSSPSSSSASIVQLIRVDIHTGGETQSLAIWAAKDNATYAISNPENDTVVEADQFRTKAQARHAAGLANWLVATSNRFPERMDAYRALSRLLNQPRTEPSDRNFPGDSIDDLALIWRDHGREKLARFVCDVHEDLQDTRRGHVFVENMKFETEPSDATIDIADLQRKFLSRMKRGTAIEKRRLSATSVRDRSHVDERGLNKSAFTDISTAVQEVQNVLSQAQAISTPWTGIDPVRTLHDVIARCRNHRLFAQGKMNLCGPAAFLHVWAGRDPVGYARFAVSMLLHGHANLGGKVITASSSMREMAGLASTKGCTAADFMCMAPLRSHANRVLPYSGPRNWSEIIEAITPASDLMTWFNDAGFCATFHDETNIFFTNGPFAKGIDHARGLWPGGKSDIILLINIDMLRSPSVVFQLDEEIPGIPDRGLLDVLLLQFFPGHYVTLLSDVTIGYERPGHVSMSIWTWGRSIVAYIPTEQFVSNYYGAIILRTKDAS